jgi:hypothetical protein
MVVRYRSLVEFNTSVADERKRLWANRSHNLLEGEEENEEEEEPADDDAPPFRLTSMRQDHKK